MHVRFAGVALALSSLAASFLTSPAAASDGRFGTGSSATSWESGMGSNSGGLTTNHEPGYCAMVGTCGSRPDGDDLNCAANVAASPPASDLSTQLQQVCPTLWAQNGGEQGKYCCSAKQVANIRGSTQKVAPFVIGCPACFHNFIHFWCVLSCSPDQATFTNVTAVRPMNESSGFQATEVDYWVNATFGERFFDSCKDVKFGAANAPAMAFIGGGAQNYQQWFDFLGLLKDKRRPPIGSPFQQNFLPGNSTPAGMTPLYNDGMPACGDNAFRCSCGDCPSGTGCSVPDDDGGGDEKGGCRVGVISCLEFAIPFVWAALCSVVAFLFFSKRWGSNEKGEQAMPRGRADVTRSASWRPLPTSVPLSMSMSGRTGEGPFGLADVPEEGPDGDRLAPDHNPLTDSDVRYPWVERQLQCLYYKLGILCASEPVKVIGVGFSVVLLCMLGLLWFRVETDPQRLWVGPSSQAAVEKAAYEASFGPFYRVEQLVVSTTPHSISPYRSAAPGSLPSIITTANLEAMFAIQAEVDALMAVMASESGGANVSLSDICYKPFGDVCATQSVLQYWAMDQALFEKEQAKDPRSVRMSPEYCFSHWFTECRSAFKAPMDPHIVLGGFPHSKEEFRNYSADATAFIVTYPVSSRPEDHSMATIWETAFIQLAKTKLAHIASEANLSLSFVAERSVQDELARESFTDASTVAASYAAMLLYIAIALGSLPQHTYYNAAEVLILSRVSLGIGGVLIVAASVAGALGIISVAGCWCTLIIMEVIPFLVLALGVDNMFVLAHALQRQDPTLPVTQRVATALAVAGPSITLAAACEIVAFGLGALTPMPAVRNFSLAAAVAVLLDFMLQVTVFVSMLALDAHRIEARRLDCIPCIRVPPGVPTKRRRSYAGSDPQAEEDEHLAPLLQESDPTPVESVLQLLLHRYMHYFHVPWILNRKVQGGVLLAFLTTLCLSIVAVPHLSVGLDQAVALPRDSYLQHYYHDVLSVIRVGPPLMLVVNNINVAHESHDVNLVCSVSGCAQSSLLNQVSAASMSPSRSFIAAPAASWLDDFLSWLNPSLPHCCRGHTGGFKPPTSPPPMSPVSSPPPGFPSSTPSLPSPQLPSPPNSAPSPTPKPTPAPNEVNPPPFSSAPGTLPSATPPPAPASSASPPAATPAPSSSLQPSPSSFLPAHIPSEYPPEHPVNTPDVDTSPKTPDHPPSSTPPGTPPDASDSPPSDIPPLGSPPQFQAVQHSAVQHGAVQLLGPVAKPTVDVFDVSPQRRMLSNGSADGYCPPPDQPPCSTAAVQLGGSTSAVQLGGSTAAVQLGGSRRNGERVGESAACADCAVCVSVMFEDGRPTAAQFRHFLPWFLKAMPSEQCAKGGAGAYNDAIQRGPDGGIDGLDEDGVGTLVTASAFRTYYTPLNTQKDFIAAMRAVRSLVAKLHEELGLEVYAYSMFHVFFEQYLTVVRDGMMLVGLPLFSVFVMSWALTGSLWGSALMAAVLASILLHLMGAMLIAGIQVNAVSMVNLAMSLGIAVEFCAHIMHAFGMAPGSRHMRVVAALEHTGASVLSGITFTKLVGVIVLGFAQTQIFAVYYFRLYLALVFVGAWHGLVLLPIFLSLAGPPSWHS